MVLASLFPVAVAVRMMLAEFGLFAAPAATSVNIATAKTPRPDLADNNPDGTSISA